jgi:tetratricopeptide (TPR) repeat protein
MIDRLSRIGLIGVLVILTGRVAVAESPSLPKDNLLATWQSICEVAQVHSCVSFCRRGWELGRAHVILARAEWEYRFGDRDSSIPRFVDVLQLHRLNILANLRVGDYLVEQSRHDLALTCYERAKLGGYRCVRIYEAIGKAKYEQGDLFGARDTLREGVRTCPTSARLRSSLGYLCILSGSVEEGIDHLSYAIKLDSGNLNAYINRAFGYASIKRWSDAKTDLDTALQLQPEDVLTLVDRGAVRLHSGDIVGAITDLSTAIAIDDELAGIAGAFLYRSQANEKVGLLDLATNDLRRAQEYPEAQKFLILE